MRDFFLATPWWVFVGLAVLAVFLLVSGNNRQDKQLKRAGLGVLVLGLILFAVSWLIETPPEIARRQTKEFVDAVMKRESEPLERLLHSNASLAKWNKADIVYGAKSYAEQFGLTGNMISGMEIDEQAGMVVVTLSNITSFESSRAPIGTMPNHWELNWLETSGGWKLKDITLIGIGQTDARDVKSLYFSGKPR